MENMPVKIKNIMDLCFQSLFPCDIGLYKYNNTWNNDLTVIISEVFCKKLSITHASK